MTRIIAALLFVLCTSASAEGFFPSEGVIDEYSNGWFGVQTFADPGQFYKDSAGIVHLSGFIERLPVENTGFTGIAFRLPQGFRPRINERFVVSAEPGAASLIVTADGYAWVVSWPTSIWVSLSGVSFRAQ